MHTQEIIEELEAQVEVWTIKAQTLDQIKAGWPKTAENVDEHKRLATKAGVFRAVARDLSLILKEYK